MQTANAGDIIYEEGRAVPDNAITEGETIMADETIFDKIKNLFVKGEDKAEDTAEEVKEDAQNAVEEVKDKAEDVIEEVKDKAEEAKDKAGDIVEDLKDKAGDVVEAVKDKLPDIGAFFESIMGKLPVDGELGEQVNEVVGSVRSGAESQGLALPDIVNKIIEALKDKFGLEGEIGEKIKAVIEFIKSKLPL